MTDDDSEFSQPIPARVKPEPGSESAAPAESSAAVIAEQDREYEVAEAADLAAAIGRGEGGKQPQSVREQEDEHLRLAIQESLRATQPQVTARNGEKICSSAADHCPARRTCAHLH